MDCVVTLDAGTGSGRAAAVAPDGRLLAVAQEPFGYRLHVDPALPMVRGLDLDPAAFWEVLARSVRRVLAALPPGARVRGVVATSQREGCVFLDAAGEPLYAGPNVDARAAMEGLELEGRLGADHLHRMTGHAPPYVFAAARWLWFRKQPAAGRLARILMLNDWITFRLTGAATAEHSSASESMLYDVTARSWSRELLDAVELPPEVLPPLRDAGTVAGAVTDEAARATGLPVGTPVFVGGADTELALLGSGVVEPGASGAVLGTTTPVQRVTAAPLLDPAAVLWTSAFVLPGRWVLESNAGDTGGAYRWLLELCFGAAGDAEHAEAERTLAAVGPEPQSAICHLGPVVFDLRKLHPFQPAGVLFRFPLMQIDRPSRGVLLRAFLESVAYAVRGNCEQIAALAGPRRGALRLSGGMTRIGPLPGLVATALGEPVEVAETPESASVGCAVLAAVATGMHPSCADAVAAMTRCRVVEPDAARVAAFAEGAARWRETVRALQEWSF